MLSEREKEFARLAIRNHYLTDHQLSRLIETRQASTPLPPLDQILVDHGYLTSSEVDELLRLTPSPSPCPSCGYRAAFSHRPGEECPQCGGTVKRPEPFVGPYEVREILGKGPTATVHRAARPGGEADLALKVLPASLDAAFLDRCYARARQALEVRHPNIAAVQDVFRHDGGVAVVSEYVNSLSLRDHVTGSIRLPLEESIALLKQVASALGEAHAHGLLHENLTPENVLVTDLRELKVTDFGLGRSPSQLTGEVTLWSLAGSMAPERWSGRSLPAADLYACGTLWAFMLTGRRPFSAPTIDEIRRRHLTINPPPPSRLAPDLPRGADAIFTKLTFKEARLRYATPAALREDLDRLEDGRTTLAEKELGRPSSTRRIKRA